MWTNRYCQEETRTNWNCYCNSRSVRRSVAEREDRSRAFSFSEAEWLDDRNADMNFGGSTVMIFLEKGFVGEHIHPWRELDGLQVASFGKDELHVDTARVNENVVEVLVVVGTEEFFIGSATRAC